MSASCPPCVRLESALAASLNFVRHVPASFPDFARSWPAVGQGRGIIRQNSFAPLRNVQRACPLVSFLHIFILAHQIRPSLAHLMLEKLFGVYVGQFPSYLHFGSPNLAFTSAPYARKTVWGLCWYNFHVRLNQIHVHVFKVMNHANVLFNILMTRTSDFFQALKKVLALAPTVSLDAKAWVEV